MPTTNETLQSLTIKHATYIERYKREQVRQIVALLNDETEPAILAMLQSRLDRITRRGFDTGLHANARLVALKAAIDAEIVEFAKRAKKMLTAELRQLAKSEAAWHVKALERAIPAEAIAAARINLTLPAPETLRAIVTEGPINGALLKDWFKSMEDSAKRAVTKAVNVGLSSGETTSQIVARVRGTEALRRADGAFQGTRVQARATVQTAITHTASQARAHVAQANRTILKGERWVTTLDSRSCVICAPRDGEVYPVGEGHVPPAHPNCRCTRIPVVKSWEELGIKVPAGTRASMDGQVPGDVTFSDWLKQQPAGRVQDVLGSKAAAKAFLSGEVPIEAFSTEMGTPLSWAQVVEKGV